MPSRASPLPQGQAPVRLFVGAGLPVIQAAWSGVWTGSMPSRASPLPQGQAPVRLFVGAGLPAILTGWSGVRTGSMPSRASPLPQGEVPVRHFVGAGLPAIQAAWSGVWTGSMPSRAGAGQTLCRSWLASDSGSAVRGVDRFDAIAGKPAPRGAGAGQIFCGFR